MNFEDLLKKRKVDVDDVVKTVKEKMKVVDAERAGVASGEDSRRDFVRGYEPAVRALGNGRIEIRLLTDLGTLGAEPDGAKVSELTINDLPIDVHKMWIESAPKRTPAGAAAVFVHIAGSSTDLERQGFDPSSLVVKGRFDNGLQFAAVGTGAESKKP